MKQIIFIYLLLSSFYSFSAPNSKCAPFPDMYGKMITIDRPKKGSCVDAKIQMQQKLINKKYGGYTEDAQLFLNNQNAKADEKAVSANKKAKELSRQQKIGGAATTATGMLTGAAAAIVCATASTGFKDIHCQYLMALTAGLVATGTILAATAKENEDIAAKYKGGLVSEKGSARLSANLANSIDGGTASELSPITLPNGDVIIPEPKYAAKYLKKHGLTWDAKKRTITTPDGKTYKADSSQTLDDKKFANLPQASAIKSFMKKATSQISADLDAQDAAANKLAANDDDNSDSNIDGGGGFSGYKNKKKSRRSNKYLNAQKSKSKLSNRVKGMFVKRGKDLIGVSQDNIFYIIHRSYQEQRKQKRFIEL